MTRVRMRPLLLILLGLGLVLGTLALQAELGSKIPVLPQEDMRTQRSNGPFDCAVGCSGELGQGNSCIESTDCTAQQLQECMPGFSMCGEHGEHDEHEEHGGGIDPTIVYPDEHSAAAATLGTQSAAPGF